MKTTDWGIEIVKVANGFSVKDNEGAIIIVEEKDGEEIIEETLRRVSRKPPLTPK